MKYVRPYKRWQKVVIWLGENPVGQLLWMGPAILLLLSPAYWLRWWWVAILGTAVVSFVLGWNMARRHVQRHGYVDKL